jgi:hypothetical protein
MDEDEVEEDECEENEGNNDDAREKAEEVPPKRKRSAKHDSDEVDGGENGVRVRSSK